jgi:hypothetical protein
MELWLAPEERELLERILASYLSDLRTEMAEARSSEYGTRLHGEERTVRAIEKKLRPGPATGVWRDEPEVEGLGSAA